MRFWIREIAGSLLVLAGLYCFLISISLVTNNPSMFFSAIQPTVIGIFVFRGGIHLLKVAVAARVCLATMPPREKPAAAAALPKPTVAPSRDW